jgi:hypothetical protein
MGLAFKRMRPRQHIVSQQSALALVFPCSLW